MAKATFDPNKRVLLYGLLWQPNVHPVQRELDCITMGGQWTKKNGSGLAGLGNFYHFKEAARLIWGDEVIQHRWFDFFLERWLTHKYVGVLGSKNSGKSFSASIFHLIDYYAFPTCTTIIVCSTTKEALEDRIWGEIKKFQRLAQRNVEWLPGHLIEGRMRIMTDDREEIEEGRDMRNGWVCIPCKKGNQYVGLSDFVGRKNKRVRLLGDEIQFLPPAFLDATANLDSSGGRVDFKLTGMGNPSEITQSLGLLCEPAAHLGGWESGIDQQPKTKSWETRMPNGVAIQLPGRDCPNMDAPEGQPAPYPFLITRKDIEEGSQKYGIDDWKFRMFFDGIFPRGQGSRRVITRELCRRGHAMDEPVWRDTNRTRIASLDSAFRAVGGDRCVFTRAEFGMEAAAPLIAESESDGIISQEPKKVGGRIVFALIEQKVIPISAAESKGAALSIEEAEDQIVKFVMAECQTYGIPPENFFFDAGMKASLVAAFARLWSPNVRPVDFDGKPTERKVSREIDVSCRDYYFNFVTEMWYQVRMVIDAGQFRGMTESAMLEGCKREFEKVAGNKIQVEPKKEMKLKTGESPDCFVAGTMVRTSRGDVPIEQIKVGELVQTPFGFSPVFAVHKSVVDTLTEAEFSNGARLRGKGKHKVFTWDKGWVRMDELSLKNTIESVTMLPVWKFLTCLNGSSTAGRSIGFKALVDIMLGTKSFVQRRDFFTALSGKTLMGLSLKASVFITKTASGGTTRSLISNLITQVRTCVSTWLNGSKAPSFSNSVAVVCEKRLLPRLRGIVLQKDLNGIARMEETAGRTGLRYSASVLNAVDHLKHFGQKLRSGARSGAEIKSPGRLTSFLGSALSAVMCFARISISGRSIAPVRVQTQPCGKPVAVYNLTLLEDNVYYANGILVQNCFDSLVIAFEGARQRGFTIAKFAPTAQSAADSRWKDDARKKAQDLWRSGALNHQC